MGERLTPEELRQIEYHWANVSHMGGALILRLHAEHGEQAEQIRELRDKLDFPFARPRSESEFIRPGMIPSGAPLYLAYVDAGTTPEVHIKLSDGRTIRIPCKLAHERP